MTEEEGMERMREAVLESARLPLYTWRQRVAALIIGQSVLACAVVVFAVSFLNRELYAGERTFGALALAAASVACLVWVLRPAKSGTQLVVAALGALVPLAVVLDAKGPTHLPWLENGACALVVLGVSLVPCVLMARALTRIAYRPLRAVNAGLAAAGPAIIALHLTCEHGDVEHLVSFHLAPMFVIVALTVALRSSSKTQTFVS